MGYTEIKLAHALKLLDQKDSELTALKKLVREMVGILLRYWVLMEEAKLVEKQLEFEADELHELNEEIRFRPEVRRIMEESQ